MMQVDFFLAYGTGAMFAVSATSQTQADRRDPAGSGSRLISAPVVTCALYLSLLLAPACVWLLARYPAWESMHMLQQAPVWGMALFGVGTVAFGVTGCVTGLRLLAKGNPSGTYLNTIVPWTLVFVVLTYGWDGWGYCRFLSPTVFRLSSCSKRPLLEVAALWARSDVATALAGVVVAAVGMGATVMTCLYAAGARSEGRPASRSVPTFLSFLVGGVLLPSLGAAGLVAATAWVAGPVAGAATLSLLFLLCGGTYRARGSMPFGDVLTPGRASPSRSAGVTDAG
ncbi:hypothetical protein QCN29_06870 [Streptomyces sp. HNM0663]|uniref:Uncharacterized protein n=1 Tax=Streptomyces chengmaiensis TaxID=3040919 RepID=A0ABT6HIB8_9ACTN|nr:hypothetical protein [Streptomyces chengmaiensis]MDH2388507.1 hypothetical protein [Streptomyces chengmaiensis]